MESWKLKLNGTWNDTKGKIKKQYAQLTEDDLLYEERIDDQLLGRLQKKLGKTKQEIKDWIESI
jgi:uncharacterized protein YjbJ (UPF0337 family)